MSHPNPFAQNVPAAEAAQPASAAPNPFAQQQAAPAAPAAPQQAPNPFMQQQAAPAAPQAYAPPQQAPQYAPPAPAQQNFAGNPYATTPGVPTVYGGAPQAYAPPAQQQYAQQGAPAIATASAPPPPVAGGGTGAKLADMYGRLVVVFPHMLQRVPKNARFVTDADRANGNLEQDRMTATVVVLDGGATNNMTPIAFGGNPHALGGRPHDQSAPLPYVRKGMWLNQSQVIGQLSDYLPGHARGGPGNTPGAAVGRIVKTGPEQNAPWFLTTPSEAELKLANDYLGLVMQGQYPHPLAP